MLGRGENTSGRR